MSLRRVIQAFHSWQAGGHPLALATVIYTEGSTYTKAGQRILIAPSGDYQGLISGGCLEGDLAERAREVISSSTARVVTYDMRDGTEDEVFGLGIGCNGLMRVLLQRLDPEGGYEPFATIARHTLDQVESVVATVVESEAEGAPLGCALIDTADAVSSFGVPTELQETLRRHSAEVRADGMTQIRQLQTERGPIDVMYDRLDRVPRVLILGAGLDAIPVVEFASRLGWRVTVADHREAYIGKGDGFPEADAALVIRPNELPEAVDLDAFDAVIVMSHHLATDRIYLAHLARVRAPYLGLLGPAARRERLLRDLGREGAELRDRLRGPVGLDIGADSPESIALSLLAEVHSTLVGGRNGGPLTSQDGNESPAMRSVVGGAP